ncbi:hypothetical protein NE237_000952 [Protea cynaroides]|uniref:DUF1218 domain-containing protein n=1 Tax=Protea cynaroides TaxID=273540 RepID=A0A9Q0KT87_9MAGN|nr:hypothetical protein NE237_000952 [Protea cynaroides]
MNRYIFPYTLLEQYSHSPISTSSESLEPKKENPSPPHPSTDRSSKSARMTKPVGALICLLIVIMDIVAGILGLQAEVAQNKMKHVRMWIFECREPSHNAFKLGLAAASLLAIAHVIANLLGGCMCFCSKDEFERASANKQLAVICLFVSWITLVIGFALLIIGALANSRSRGACGFSRHHLLSIGGILCFVHGLFCVAYYVSASATTREEEKWRPRSNTGGTQMAQRGPHGSHPQP